MRSFRRLTVVTAAAAMLGAGLTAASATTAPADTGAAGTLPRPAHVVVVMMENKRYDSVVGHPKTPYVSQLANRWANLTQMYAETHPSQPNYLALFSGSTQGVTDNSCPHDLGAQPNLGRQLQDAGFTFTGYAESIPQPGYRGCTSGGYARKHNPWVNFANIPATSNQSYSAFPADYNRLPTLSFVVPNLCHDMHDCPKAQGDRWLQQNFDRYITWATTHNSLFILTYDEDNNTDNNHIATIIAGAGVRPGQYTNRVDHYDLLRTIEAMYGLPPLGAAASRAPLTGVWAGR
jgi:phospholipase C